MPVQFGPDKAKQYKTYHRWLDCCRKYDLLPIAVSNGIAVQDRASGTNKGFWSFNLKKGWIKLED